MIHLNKPRDSDIHTVADFAELLCLVTIDRDCSKETIVDQLKDVGDTKISDVELDDCFNHIEWRQSAFGEYYPFTLDKDGKNFSASDDLNDKQKLYTLLLLCANLPFILERGNITDVFERIALYAMRSIWADKAILKAFGKNETDYNGEKWERLNALAEDIGAVGRCSKESFRKGDSGDGGIDIVAWLELDNFERKNKISLLAQCACSRESWPSKQSEISRDRLSLIHPSHPWMQMICIPHSFRNNHGKWAVEGEIASCIIFDRLRILMNTPPVIDWNEIQPTQLFNDFLGYRMPLV